MAQVIEFPKLKRLNASDVITYSKSIENMDMRELLEEMVRFQDERSRVGHLTDDMIVFGKVLFKSLEENAQTEELRLLTRSYRRHLIYEEEYRGRKNV